MSTLLSDLLANLAYAHTINPIVVAFTLTNFYRIWAFKDQLVKLALWKAGDKTAVSHNMWFVMFIAHLTAAMYFSDVVHDQLSANMFWGNTITTLGITVLAALRNYQAWHAHHLKTKAEAEAECACDECEICLARQE